jgi:ATP/maltotriose-dependent transcriptional regulator MalT
MPCPDDTVTVERARVAARLAKALSFPIALLQAPAGSGKSVALRDALAADLRPYVTFTVTPAHATLPRFARGLAESLAAHAPGARISFPSAYDRAILSDDPARTLAHWLHEHIRALNLTIAVDDAHNAHSEPAQRFLGRVMDLSAPGLRWAAAMRSADYLPVANWLASARTGLPIEEDDLAFTIEEIAQLARERAFAYDAGELQAVYDRTLGWAAGVAFGGIGLAYEPIVELLLAQCDDATRAALFSAYYLPDLSPELVAAAGGDDLSATIERLRTESPFLFVETNGTARFHDVFRDALHAQMAGATNDELARVALERASNALLRLGRYVDVLELFFEGAVVDCIEILDAHGVQLLEEGHAELVESVVTRLQRSGAELPPRVIALRALVDSRLGRLDTAESWFNQALAAIEDDADVRMIEIKYLYACDLLRRDRLDALPLLREHADDVSIAPDLHVAILSAYAEALQLANDPVAASAAIDEALSFETGLRDPAVHARVLARAAYVALYQEDYARARSHAIAAARAATEAALYTVAIGAYSVLYVIAYDEEEMETAIHYLELMLESCLKSGSLQFQFYCLACMFEIEVERDNGAAIRRIESTMESFDLHIAGSESDEAFLPGHAMRSAARGDFARAYRLLHPTAMHQAGAERIAQRWSEVALYAAGARKGIETAEALDRGLAALEQCGTTSARSARARLNFALALALTGSEAESLHLLAEVTCAQELPQRVRTIEAGVTALCGYARGEQNHRELATALRAMHDGDCGGIARLFEALPARIEYAREVPA